MTNETCVKSSIAPQAYNVVSTHAHEISGWAILSRLVHLCDPNLVGINGYVKYDLDTLDFKNGEQLEDFHIIIIRNQQEITLSGEYISPTRLLSQ